MQKHTDPTLATVQTREALRLCRHYFGAKPTHVSYAEKCKQAELEMHKNFRTRVMQVLATYGIKVRP